MNGTQPHFIDRDDELKRIEEHVTAWNTLCILIVDGPGGIGKTRLLEETYRRRQDYTDVLKGRLRTTRVINLDDITFQTPMNLGYRIANEVGTSRFRDYLDDADQLVLMESKGLLTAEGYEREFREGDHLFLRACHEVAQEERILLILDTLEAVLSLPIAQYLAKMAANLKNAFVLLAGREGEQAQRLIAQALDGAQRQDAILDYLQLEAFTPSAAKDYLSQTAIGDYLDTHAHLRDNLLLLTENRPLLLGLAAEWLRQDVPLPELTERAPDELRALPSGEMECLRKQFEKALVSNIRGLREEIADLILYMAHFNMRFDAELLSAITGLSADEGKQKIKSLGLLFFVKQKPDGILVLHDEMQRLVDEQVWPEVDPFGTRRKQLSQESIDHYHQRIAWLDKAARELEIALQVAEVHQDIAGAAETRREYLELKRLRWTLTRELLHYALDADLIKGCELFMSEFDAATAQYQFMLRTGFVQEVASYESNLSDLQKYEVGIRIAKYHLDEGEYVQAKARLVKMQEHPLIPAQRADVLLQLGNAEVRLGNIEQAISIFREGVEVCQAHNLKKELTQAENALGWGYRHTGDWDEAASHYRKALKLALKLQARQQEGLLLNNLAFVYATQDKRDESMQLSDQALRVWATTESKRGLGAAYSTRGTILYKFGQFDEALKYFAEALAFFESQNDIDWLSTVYSWRGVTLWAIGRLEEAHEDQEKALKIGLKRDAAMVLNRMARIYRSLGQNAEARQFFNQSYQAALETRDSLYEAATLSDLACMEVEEHNFSTLDDFLEKLDSHLRRQKSPHVLPLGRLYRHMGALALGLGRVEEAISYYKRGFELVAERGGYGTVTLLTELGDSETTLVKLATPEFIRQLAEALGQHWETTGLEISDPEALPVFARWEQWPEQEAGQ